MKSRIMLLAAGVVACLAIVAGCATLNTPAKVASALCAPTNIAVNDFNAFALLYPTLPAVQTGSTILAKYKPTLDAVCAESATVTATNLQNLINQGIPAVAAIVATVPMPAATQAAIQGGFAAAELVVGMVGLYENALSTAKSAVAVGMSADSVVLAAKMSVKASQ